jgi:hypothetical protein
VTATLAAHTVVPPCSDPRPGGVAVWPALVVAVWLGSAVLFSLVVAPAAFAVVPTRALAGLLVGRVLRVVLLGGVVAGGIVVAGAWAGGVSGRARAVCAGAGLVTVVACGVAQWVVGARIADVRAGIGASLDALAVTDPRRVAFGRLHALSVALLGLGMLAAGVVLVVWAVAAGHGAARAVVTRRPDG